MRSATWAKWAVIAIVLGACSGDDGADGGRGDAGDAGSEDGGFLRHAGETSFGGACRSTSDCAAGLSCDRELPASFEVDGLPLGATAIDSPSFPNGLCTPVAAAPFDPNGVDSCVPAVPQAEQGCGDDGKCIQLSAGGEVLVACRPRCDPAERDPCGGRFGYTCDFDEHACVEGCQSNEECRILLVDGNGDGQADALAYDNASEAVCDSHSFRCVHDGGGDTLAGDACERLDDCEGEGVCIDSLQTLARFSFPGGYCTKLGCDQPGRECDDQAVCERLRPLVGSSVTTPLCLHACEVGAEAEADRLGEQGHGAGCRTGYSCHYNGGRGHQGVCAGGNYNAVTENNVGAACSDDSDCYSPFGLGACMALGVGDVQAPTGVCSILDCAAPGLPDDVCGAGNACIGLSGDVTFCVKKCGKAEVCADGYACADDDGAPETDKICYPACFEDADCPEGSTCSLVSADAGYGACLAPSP